MTVGSGVGASAGIASEGAVYGTFVPPTRWTEFESESLAWNPARTVGQGLSAGTLVTRASQRQTTTSTVAGDFVTPVYSKGMGYWLGLIFGSMGITPVVQGATTAYLQTHALGVNSGQSASVQIGRPTMDGVQHQYNYRGLVVTKAVFEAKVDQPLRLTLSCDAQGVDETSAYVTAVYQTPNPALFWNQGSFLMGVLGAEAVVQGVRSFTLTIERPQKVDNFYLIGSGLKSRPVQNDFVKVTGALETDFLSKASFVDVFYNDTPQSIIVPFVGGLIGGAYNFGLSLTMPHCRFDDEPPMVGGVDILQPKMSFEALYDDVHPAIGCTYTSTDTTL